MRTVLAFAVVMSLSIPALAQQTIFAEVDFNPAAGSVGPAGLFNVDQWDGYVAQRRRISQFLADRRPANPIVVTGDIHSSWANDVKLDYDDPASPTVAAEFVGTERVAGRADRAQPPQHVALQDKLLHSGDECSSRSSG